MVLDGKQAGRSSLTSELIFVASNNHVPSSRCKFLNLAGEGEGDEDETHHLLTCVAAPQVKIRRRTEEKKEKKKKKRLLTSGTR